MTRYRHRRYLPPLLMLLGCKAHLSQPESRLRTDETKASILSMCDTLSPDGSAEQLLANACDCLTARTRTNAEMTELSAAFCGSAGQAYFARLSQTAKAESLLVMQDDAGTAPTVDEQRCADDLAVVRHERVLEHTIDACRNGSDAQLRSLITLPTEADTGACWRFTRMDQDNCVIATPCVGRGPANIRALPIAGGGAVMPEGTEVRLCNATIQTMHALKDPLRQNSDYNYPFANYLAFGHANKTATYGAANCHGTAQAPAGNFLAALPVTDLSYQGPQVQEQCGARAQAAYDQARAAARTTGNGAPTGAHLPIERGGYVINMNHEAQCAAADCGKATFNTYDCGGDRLEANVFFDGMCINCWDTRLQGAGYRRLPADATWRELTSNCVLTTSDHSVTVTYVNDGFCYFYESLAPYAAPQMNVLDCPQLFHRFPMRWCSDNPFLFDWR